MGFIKLPRWKTYRRRSRKTVRFESTEETNFPFRVQQLTSRIFTLEEDLQKSNHTTELLRAQLAEYDMLLAHAQCRVGETPPPTFQTDEQSVNQASPAVSPSNKTSKVWIDDIWLCNDAENIPIQEAEAYWKNGSPQSALEIVSQAIDANPFLSATEDIRCRIFAAAVLHSMGRFEVSNRRLGVIIESVSRYSLLNDLRSRDLVGIAYYVFGRNLIEMGEFAEAYYSLSRALGTPGYHNKTRDYQKAAVVEFTRQKVMAETASVSSSLQPTHVQ
ncbi:uncharacterized protein N7483_010784 [Penicillium malachiteum]|uniref:uncharacterized protein n=1 Tax=Penicillium malachiteum TaxID=1324776 RepID=UPI0025476674|nr:uncharacterized protein N7483_010784 [Penicillium malachiteum]KAJ5713603.1 hypothetical protein N7483_010784 [Penicillium malachiteum]